MNKYRVMYAATYVGEFMVDAPDKDSAQEAIIETKDPEGAVYCDDGTRLEFCDGEVTRVELEAKGES